MDPVRAQIEGLKRKLKNGIEDNFDDTDEIRRCKEQIRHLDEFGDDADAEYADQCLACTYKPTSRLNLVIHVKRSHMGDSPEQFECVYCGKRFSQSMHLNGHVNA